MTFALLIGFGVSFGQTVESSNSSCNQYETLSDEVLRAAINQKNNGKFRLNTAAINLLESTDNLIGDCANLVKNRLSIKLALGELLILRNELEKAEKIISKFPVELLEDNKKYQSEYKLLRALLFSSKGNNKKAILLAGESLELFIENRNPKGAAKTLWLLGSIYEDNRQGETAINYYKRAVRVGELKNFSGEYILESILHIGNVSYQNKDYANALKYYKLGQEKAIKSSVTRLIPFSYYHLGKYYFDVEKNSEKALENLSNGMKAVDSLKLNSYFIAPIILQKMGIVHYKSNNRKMAIKYFTEAIESAERNNQKRLIPIAYKHLTELKNN